jgi:threonine/homoserine/homoserine lactone efflux protein
MHWQIGNSGFFLPHVVSILYSLLVGFGLDKVLKRYPDLTATLQILGALYLVYLAYKFIKPRPRQADINKTYNFWNGVILQALNPKAFSL